MDKPEQVSPAEAQDEQAKQQPSQLSRRLGRVGVILFAGLSTAGAVAGLGLAQSNSASGHPSEEIYAQSLHHTRDGKPFTYGQLEESSRNLINVGENIATLTLSIALAGAMLPLSEKRKIN